MNKTTRLFTRVSDEEKAEIKKECPNTSKFIRRACSDAIKYAPVLRQLKKGGAVIDFVRLLKHAQRLGLREAGAKLSAMKVVEG